MKKYLQYFLFIILGIIAILLIDKFIGWAILIVLILVNYDKLKEVVSKILNKK